MRDEERTPLRTVLINFLNHIENLESEKFPEKSYDSEFQDLKLFSESVRGLKQYSCLEGEKEVNKKKNRYKDILPFDLSRVILNEYAGIPGSDYINANYIKGASGSIAYIASQGPLPNTVCDFWRMVVQCEVQVIVMACNEEEAGKTKCEKYWVEDGEERQFGMVSVKLLKASTVCPDFSVRTMRLKYTNSQSVTEERTVCQLHYVAWPDHGVPTVVQPLLDMVRLVRDTQASETLPVLIHCSAGCGRTGTICAIDYVWGLLRTGKLSGDFSLLGLVREMRRQRIAMVQTKEQYVLVHQAVRELFREQLSMIDAHPYENVDSNGMVRLKEEPVYDTVGSFRSATSNDEKRDDKREKEVAPPLPLKRRPSVLSSKQEKEVENITARQKLLEMADSSSESVTSSSTGSGRISKVDKLKSQFEINYDGNPHNLVKKLSLLSSQRSPTAKPIPSRGVLKVPQLESQNFKSVPAVKRSKSLKILSSEERQKLTVCSEMNVELRRRSSLESNVEDHCETWIQSDSDKPGSDKSKDSGHVCQIVKDYEALCLSDNRRPLGRSYTTLDMRQKPILHPRSQVDVNINVSISGLPVKNRRKISRSHTQLELGKPLQISRLEKQKSPEMIYNVPKHFQKPQIFKLTTPSDKVPLYLDVKTLDESPSVNTPKSSIVKRREPAVKAFVRTPDKVVSPAKSKDLVKKGETSPQKLMDQKRYRNVMRVLEPVSKSDFAVNGTTSGMMTKSPGGSKPRSSRHQWDYDLHLYSRSQEPIYTNLGATEQKPQLNRSPQKPTEPDRSKKPNTPADSRYHKQGVYRDVPGIYSPRSVPNPVIKKTPGSRGVQSKRPGVQSSPTKSSVEFRSQSIGNEPRPMQEDRTQAPINSQEEKPGVRSEVPLIQSDQHTPNYGVKMRLSSHDDQAVSASSSSSSKVKRHTSVVLQRPVSMEQQHWKFGPLGNGDSRTHPSPSHGWEGDQPWQSAPGVDIDQVAASISQKEGSRNKLIKAALEALHLRKSKPQPDPSSHSPGTPHGESSKKQQYL